MGTPSPLARFARLPIISAVDPAGGPDVRGSKEVTIMRISLAALLALCALSVFHLGRPAAGEEKPKAERERLFEMRTYTAAPGKLDALNARFREHTNKLFVKHGMEIIGYWTPADGPTAANTLVYIVAHRDREAMEKSWKGFGADADWRKARDASEVNGKLVEKVVSVVLKPTDYSPIR